MTKMVYMMLQSTCEEKKDTLLGDLPAWPWKLRNKLKNRYRAAMLQKLRNGCWL
jgi:hypothetical protein